MAYVSDKVFGEIVINIISKRHIFDAINFSIDYSENFLAIEIMKVLNDLEKKYDMTTKSTDQIHQDHHVRCRLFKQI